MTRLRRSNPRRPGLTRRRRGRGWEYLTADGRRIQDRTTLDRVNALVIPPAWQQVWISPAAEGHIQAIGTDAAGRRQYRYHDAWSTLRHLLKFDRVAAFAAALPAARTIVSEHLAQTGLPRSRVLAAAFRLLDQGHFRIGGEVYAATNGSVGLATLRREHARHSGDALVFEYTAKSGIHHVERVVDDELTAVVDTLRRRRSGGPELLAFRDGRAWGRIHSADINGYLKEVTGQDISAKDFRTWHGTTMAAVALTGQPAALSSRNAVAKAQRQAVMAVAEQLGNTPAVCRASYIDPRVLDAFERDVRIDRAVSRAARRLEAAGAAGAGDSGPGLTQLAFAAEVEWAVRRLLRWS